MIRDQAPIPADARAVLTINLGALRANWGALNHVSGAAECAGVIKANAYGLGLEQITRALVAEGCRTFFVATLTEARIVRGVSPGAAIYVLDGLLPGASPHYAGFDLRPCLASLAEIREWAAYCDATGRRLRAAVHVDTGINRMGLPLAEVETLAGDERGLFDHFDLALVMSHLACADEPDNPVNALQLARFQRLRAMLPSAPASLANSGGTFLGPDYHFDLVRPGIALYGGRAFEGSPNPMQWVVRLQARILQVRDVAAGDSIGYGATYQTQRPSRVATLACGYADGFLRALSGPSGWCRPTRTCRLSRRLRRTGDRARLDGPHHRRRHRRAAKPRRARGLGGSLRGTHHDRRLDGPRRHHRIRIAHAPRTTSAPNL